MSDATQFTIGAAVHCTDGECGSVTRVVVDPVARVLTHLVVEPRHRVGLGRLVPLELVEASDDDGVGLRCSLAGFDELAPAEETRFLPGGGVFGGYAPGGVLNWPYFGLGPGARGGLDLGLGAGSTSAPIVVDTVPVGEVAVRRGEAVHATDGDIGRVQGLIVDPASRHVTHVLLQEGHLWGSHQVAIPIGSVADVDDGIRLRISKHDVEGLPPVDIDASDGRRP